MQLLFPDLGTWNNSISQRWRRLRKCCSSFKSIGVQSGSGGGNCHLSPQREKLLVPDQTKYAVVSKANSTNGDKYELSPSSSSVRLQKKTGSVHEVQQLLKSKFNRLQSGLKKRRALSVQEVFTGSNQQPNKQPTFYVPSPLEGCDRVPAKHDYKSLPGYADPNPNTKDIDNECDYNSHYRIIHSSSFDVLQQPKSNRRGNGTGAGVGAGLGLDFGYHSIESHVSEADRQEIDRSRTASFRSVRAHHDGPPDEPEPDYEDDLAPPKRNTMRRWSVTNGLGYRHLSRFESTNRAGRPQIEWEAPPDNGPTSLPYNDVNGPPAPDHSKPDPPKRTLPKICSFGKSRERTRSHSPSSRKKDQKTTPPVESTAKDAKFQSSKSAYDFEKQSQEVADRPARFNHYHQVFIISHYYFKHASC